LLRLHFFSIAAGIEDFDTAITVKPRKNKRDARWLRKRWPQRRKVAAKKAAKTRKAAWRFQVVD
jgi:hypothetical protein